MRTYAGLDTWFILKLPTPAWIFGEIGSVPSNLGKCKKVRNTPKLRMQKRKNRQMRRLRKGNRVRATTNC